MAEVRAVAFGDPQIWGVGWLGDPGSPARLMVASESGAAVLEGVLEAGGLQDAWRLAGEELSLEFTPAGLPARGGATEELETLDQICTVSGRLQLEGGSSELQSLGWRSLARGKADLAKVGSFRWVAAWLGPQDGFSLMALRPRRARGHEDDIIAAALVADPPLALIDDPRLSTTYNDSGLPARVGLELWLDEQSPVDDGADAPPQYPRRAAGQVISRGPDWNVEGFQLQASLLSWRAHGQEGPGVYVLGQRP